MMKAQGSIEFFLIAGFILLAASVLLTQADNQIRGTSALNNVIVARSAIDSAASTLKYAYFSGNMTTITTKYFVPVGAQCFYIQDFKFYCIVPGTSKRVVSDTLAVSPAYIVVDDSCHRSGWLQLKTQNYKGLINLNCT